MRISHDHLRGCVHHRLADCGGLVAGPGMVTVTAPGYNLHVREETPAFVGQVFWAGKCFWRVLPQTVPGNIPFNTEPVL